jgi:hypothetical protein
MFHTGLLLVLESWVVRRETAEDDSHQNTSCVSGSRGSEW